MPRGAWEKTGRKSVRMAMAVPAKDALPGSVSGVLRMVRRSGHGPREGVPPRVVEFGDRTGPGSGGGLEGVWVAAHGANQEHPVIHLNAKGVALSPPRCRVAGAATLGGQPWPASGPTNGPGVESRWYKPRRG